MRSIVFRLRDVRVKLGQSVVERLRSHIQTGRLDAEAGGVLLGRKIKNTAHSVIDEVTTPMRGDRRARASFNRRDPGHQKHIDKVWEASDGTTVYLGEWHTHPELNPHPSEVDFRDWVRRLSYDQVPSKQSFFLIVGTRDMGLWCGDRKKVVVERMKLESTS